MTALRTSRVLAAAATALCAALPTSACGVADEPPVLTVLASASLSMVMSEVAAELEARHDVDVRLVTGSSATLAQQVVDGAPADVLATADLDSILTARDALDSPPQPFATNRLVLAVNADAPEDLRRLADLDRPGTVWVACVATAPCGAAADEVLAAVGVRSDPASREVDVAAVLAKVTSGEADAGLVYRTDTLAVGDVVRTSEPPGRVLGVVVPQIAVVQEAEQPGLARDFVDLVLSETGRDLLREHGFGLDHEPHEVHP